MSLGVLLSLSCLLPAVFAVVSLVMRPSHRFSAGILFGSALLCATVAVLAWNTPAQWQAPAWLGIGWIPISLRCDTLSSVYMLLLGTVTASCAVFSPPYLNHLGNKISTRFYWSALFAFIAGMVLVLLSTNAVVFLVSWELMSLASAALVVSEYQKRNAQHAAFIYVVATRIATIFLTGGFLLMFGKFHDLNLASWNFSEPSSWLAATFICIGLIIKAGIWPFHIWLPYAHPEAPTPVSALMSGVMVKMAVYAAIRFFIFGHLDCVWLAYALFLLSVISAFWGVLFAINQRELKRLLAYSTVENVGLVFLAIALCIWARSVSLNTLAQLALLAAILHSIAHGLFKSLLFLCAGSVDFAAHSRELAMLGGLNKRMPMTGITFVLGSAAICAIPPLNGFASKWCLYQALFRSSIAAPALIDRAVCIIAIGVLSGVGALAIACFAKAIGVVFLGKPRSNNSANAREVPSSMFLPQALLALACVVMGACAQWLVHPILPVLSTIAPTSNEINIFTSIKLWQVAAGLVLLILSIYALVLRRAPQRFRTWDCGFSQTSTRSQVTADSFAQPIARIFTPVLRYRLNIDISGRDHRHFPEKIAVEPSMVSLLETKIYGPLGKAVHHLAQLVAKLQAGSIHLYLAYVCIALVILMALGTRL